MKVNIVVHSQSGHTARVARAVASILRDRGSDPDLMLLRPVGKVHPGATDFSLKSLPEIEPFDALMFGGPVWAFGQSPVIRKCLAEIPSLKGKKALGFVTMGFPFRVLGGTRAIRQINEQLDLLGADVHPGTVLPYTIPPSDEKVKGVAEEIVSHLLSA